MSAGPPLVGGHRVRVLTVLPADPERLAIGGIATFVRGFVKFAPDDFDLGFVGMSGTRSLLRWHEVEIEGRPVRFLPVTRGGDSVRRGMPSALRFSLAMAANRRALQGQLRGHPWVAAFHRPGSDLAFPMADGPRWRVVHLSVADLATPGSESRWRRLSPALDRLERRSFRTMDRVYVVNRAVADDYRRRYAEISDRLTFLPNWADPTIFRPMSPSYRTRVRAELGLAPDAPTVLFAGRLEGQKDPLLLADAFAQVRRKLPGVVLLVVGEGAMGEQMRDLLHGRHKATDAVRFLGIVPRDRLAELMNAADLLAITSAFETGPTVGLEALACGLPVVTTPVGEVSAIVAEAGAGHTTASRSPEAVARGLLDVLERAPHLRTAAVEAAAPYLADRVLGTLYDDNRLLAARLERP
ncbi:MAG TPA: glycosyltransferase family 4 protein [Candidatus Limnocylindria bacterium]